MANKINLKGYSRPKMDITLFGHSPNIPTINRGVKNLGVLHEVRQGKILKQQIQPSPESIKNKKDVEVYNRYAK